ncbi:MAG: hypothetical protein Q8L48_15330 [Archangium sp.]|nr:hypothetical protein [Archangium sp.]
MICPVCEHQQEFGMECEVCGKELGGLAGLGPPPVQTVRMEGLEVTVPEKLGEVPVEKMGELEVTRFAAVNVAPDVTPDLDFTARAPVGDIPIDRVADMSEDRVPDDGQRTAFATGPATCRYCRNVQATGTMCERCGMKLPIVAVPPLEAIVGKALSDYESKVRCRSCGAPAKAGERCGDCGREVPYPDA